MKFLKVIFYKFISGQFLSLYLSSSFWVNGLNSTNITTVNKDKIIGIDARGFIFASPFAYNNRIPLVLARKKGKLPGELISKTYDLEYGKSTIEMQRDNIKIKDNVIIVDDLCATGGTILATIDMVKELNAKVIAVLCIIDLPDLGGSTKIKEQNIPFYSAVNF